MLGLKTLCLALVAGCVATFAASAAAGDVGLASYPGVLLAAVIVILPIHVVGQYAMETDRGWLPELPGDPSSRLRLMMFVGAWLAAIWLMPVVGFIAAMVAGVCLSLGALGGYRIHRSLPLVLVLVIGVFALVERVLYVPMPRGPLEDAIGGFLFRLAQGGWP